MLVLGAAEPELGSWLRAEGHATRTAANAEAALAALDEEPAELVIVDREPGGLDAPAACVALREDARLGGAWLLAIAGSSRRRAAEPAYDVGADDYLHRPFTRAQLLARVRTGLRAVEQRTDDAVLRSMLATVPGAIYRSAWHAGQRLELITDEIERISGFPADNFVASAKRTLVSIVHPDDRAMIAAAVEGWDEGGDHTFSLEYRIVRADGEIRWVLDRGQLVKGAGGQMWMNGALFDITERRAAEEALRRREIEAARTEELRASRARIVAAADEARRKLERDLHDGAQQRLVSMALDVRVARRRLDDDPDSAGPFLDRLGDDLAGATSELRELARGIHPAVLTDRGLAPAVEALAGRSAVPVELRRAARGAAPADGRDHRVLHGLRGARRTSPSTRRPRTSPCGSAASDDDLAVEVRDDGIGGARATPGSGLSGLADRVGATDGTLEVVSPPGEGTLVRAVIPLAPDEAAVG